jgi:anthranilate phosphoribosyltransferase
MKYYLDLLMNKTALTREEAQASMAAILDDKAKPHQIAAFLAILKYRGETVEEVVGMLEALEKSGPPIALAACAMDIVGTGGDHAHTVNISTGSAILAAACGIPIAKHGNRAVSSRCGSADVLEALGIEVEMPPHQLNNCIEEVNIAFMFAPFYHPVLQKLKAIRTELNIPTIFNLLGPLLNPAQTPYALIGTATPEALELIAHALCSQGNKKRALVFCGNGLDELSPIGKTVVYDIRDKKIETFEIDPHSLGMALCSRKDLQGGDPSTNATLLEEVFAGRTGPIADALILNAGTALFAYGHSPSILDGVNTARSALRQKKALDVLEKWRAFSRKIKLEKHNAAT